jgi:acetyl-CoA decarbonylase/synthase complex subunit delta
LALQFPKQTYNGKIATMCLGMGPTAVQIGGADAYPFHLFEGQMPNRPKIAMEVWDYDPATDWPAAARAPFQEVLATPADWARKCVQEFGADLIVLQLKSTDPNGRDVSATRALETVLAVLAAIEVPLIVWGTANHQKDEEVLKGIAEKTQGKNIVLAPVEETNHKGLGAVALAYGHTVTASSPIDVNLAKQLNILLGNLGVAREKTLIDPTTGGLGYGLEYSYSVMERIRMAALTQEDEKLQMPLINNIGNEVWKTKEAGTSLAEAPAMGDPEKRAVLMETVSAVCYLLAGSDVVILRHPESVRLVRLFIDLLMNGGKAQGLPGIRKRLESKEVDLSVLMSAGSKPAAAALKTEAKVLNEKTEPSKIRNKEEKSIAAADNEKQKQNEKLKAQKPVGLKTPRAVVPMNQEKPQLRKALLVRKKKEPLPKTPARVQLDLVDKLARNLDRIHGR